MVWRPVGGTPRKFCAREAGPSPYFLKKKKESRDVGKCR